MIQTTGGLRSTTTNTANQRDQQGKTDLETQQSLLQEKLERRNLNNQPADEIPKSNDPRPQHKNETNSETLSLGDGPGAVDAQSRL
jgi:hypothetical protein